MYNSTTLVFGQPRNESTDPRLTEWYGIALATEAPTEVEHEVELEPAATYWSISSVRWESEGPHQNLYSTVSLVSGSVAFKYEFLDLVLVELLLQIPLYETGELVVLDSEGRVLLASNITRANTTAAKLQVHTQLATADCLQGGVWAEFDWEELSESFTSSDAQVQTT